MRVYLVRHAEAASGHPDEARELTPSGLEEARALGMQLAADDVRPDAVLTSPLKRARQTADELARALGVDAEADDRLGPGASADGLRDAVAGRGDVVVAVGHNPDWTEIAAEVSGKEVADLPPAGVAVVELE